MKVVICGDRDCEDMKVLQKAVKDANFEITEIVSGTAKGADKLGEEYAKIHNIPVKKFPADWKNLDVDGAVVKEGQYGKYNSRAGFMRDIEMVEYADAVIALQPYGESAGTQITIREAKKRGLPTFVAGGVNVQEIAF